MTLRCSAAHLVPMNTCRPPVGSRPNNTMRTSSPAPTRCIAARPGVLAVVLALVLVGACGGGSDGGTATVDSNAEVAVIETSLPGPEAVDTTVTPVAGTTAPEVSTFDGGDGCLQGTWMADASLIQAFMDTLGSPLRFEVGPSSVWNLTFEGDQVTGSNAVTLGVRINESLISVSGATQLAGMFDSSDGVLDAEFTTNVTEYSEWSAEIDGQPVPLAVAPAAPPAVGPEFGGAAYTCTAEVLTVSPPSGIGPAQYRRA